MLFGLALRGSRSYSVGRQISILLDKLWIKSKQFLDLRDLDFWLKVYLVNNIVIL